MSRVTTRAMAGAALCVGIATGAAIAQDKSRFTLFNPTPRDEMRDFNTDRPTKVNSPYTVDAGHFQYEGDLFFYSYDNTSAPDTTITTWTVGNPTFKVGVLNNVDFEVNFSAYNNVQTNNRSTGTTTRAAGLGDIVTRAKINLFGNDGGSAALALMPYGKWPTAPQGVGNQLVEGGMAVPFAIALPGGITTIVMGQVDVLKNPIDNAYHLNFPAILNLNRQIVPGVTAYAEFYANWSTHREVRDIYTLDFALAWTPKPNFQLDVGVYIGLVPAAAAYQLYAGVSQRF